MPIHENNVKTQESQICSPLMPVQAAPAAPRQSEDSSNEKLLFSKINEQQLPKEEKGGRASISF